MEIHIGSMIRLRAKELRIGPTELGSKINTSKQNVYGIYKRRSIDTRLLVKISVALDCDFFKYYTKSLAPLAEKIPAAMVVLLFIGLVVYALVCGYRYVRSKDKCCSDSLVLMILGSTLFFIGKILDRSASILEKSFEIVISPNTKRYIFAYEEGLEMITPLMFVISFVWRESPSEELA